MISKKFLVIIAFVFTFNMAFVFSASAEEVFDVEMMKKVYEEKQKSAYNANQGNNMASGVNRALRGGLMIYGPEYLAWEKEFVLQNTKADEEAIKEDEFLAAAKKKFQENQLYSKIIKINSIIKNALSSMQD
jgi:hypothetical protein